MTTKSSNNSRIVMIAGLVTAVAVAAAVAILFWPASESPHEALPPVPAPANTAATTEVREALPLAPLPTPKLRPVVENEPAALAGVVTGTVLDLDGRVVNDVAVSLTARGRLGAAATALPSTLTDDAGRFTLSSLPIDFYTVTAQSDGGIAMEQAALFDHAPCADVTLILRPGGPIGGEVRGPDGAIAGARVAAMSHDGDDLSRTERSSLVCETDDEGHFRFDALASGSWVFYVSAAGYGPVVTDALAVGTEDVVVELSAGAVAEGMVFDGADGAPLAGMTVTAQRVNYAVDPERVISGEDGAFRFANLAEAEYVFDVDDREWSLRDGPVSATVNELSQSVDLYVLEGGVVRGRLINGTTGAALAGGRILALPADRRAQRRTSGVTDGSGNFVVRGLSAGSYTLKPDRMAGINNTIYDGEPVTVQATPGEVLDGVEIIVNSGITISGVVVYPDGQPAAGADVRGVCREVGWQDQIVSGADGSFVLGGIREPLDAMLSAAVGDYENADLGPFTVPSDGLQDLRMTLDLPRDGAVSGQVVDERGAPLEARILAVQDGRSFPAMAPMFESGPDGRFLLAHMVPGEWQLFVSAGTRDQTELDRITLAPGQVIDGLRLVLPVGDRKPISGRVTNEAGKPLRGHVQVQELRREATHISIMPPSSFQCDPEGYYVTGGLAPGEYRLTATAANYGESVLDGVEPGSEGVDFVLPAGLHVAGTVVDERGNPVTAFGIAALSTSQPSPSGLPYQRVSDGAGRFYLPVEPGTNYLCIEAAGFRPECFHLRPSADVASIDDLVLQLTAGGARLTGLVVDGAGKAVAQAEIFVGGNLRSQPSARSGDDGSFVVDPVEPGVMIIAAQHITAGHGSAEVELADGKETKVTIVIDAPGAVAGVVTSGGQPVAGATVVFSSDAIRGRGAQADEAGQFLFEGLPAGAAQITVHGSQPGVEDTTVDVEVVAGETVPVVVEIP